MFSILLAQGITADDTGLGTTATAAGYDAAGSLPILIGNLIGFILGFVGLIVFVFILYGGFLWMTSQGNEEQVTKAKGMITNAIIGFIIVTAAYAIATFVIESITKLPTV